MFNSMKVYFYYLVLFIPSIYVLYVGYKHFNKTWYKDNIWRYGLAKLYTVKGFYPWAKKHGHWMKIQGMFFIILGLIGIVITIMKILNIYS